MAELEGLPTFGAELKVAAAPGVSRASRADPRPDLCDSAG